VLSEGFIGTAEAVPFQNCALVSVFAQPVKPCPLKIMPLAEFFSRL